MCMLVKSIEIAHHDVTVFVEASLAREYTSSTFLDIEGAFNNGTTCSIGAWRTKEFINGVLFIWGTKWGLLISTYKKETDLYSRWHTIDIFSMPRLDNKNLSIFAEAKYLGIILDFKLNWKRVMERFKI